MEIERIQCLVRLNQKGKTELATVVKAGPDAVPATEIPILRTFHDVGDGMIQEECSISAARVVGSFETTKAQEFERLKLKYGEAVVKGIYPQGRMMPSTLDDCDLPPGCRSEAPAPKKEAKQEPKSSDRVKELRKLLDTNGVKVPSGNLSVEDLEALIEESDLTGDA